jgi:hypothetical protein
MRFTVFALLLGTFISTAPHVASAQAPRPSPNPPIIPEPPKVPPIVGTFPGKVPNPSSTNNQPDTRGAQLPISSEVRHKQRLPEKIKDTISEGDAKARGRDPDATFKSWSLFLMPDYDAPYKKPDLVRQLKKAFENLGRAIGPDNVSLWLVTGEAEEQDHPESVYDYERAQEIIGQLDLDSATGPYIVITLTSPNYLSPGMQAFVARLTGIRVECYPQVVDSLAEYIRERQYDSARDFYNSVQEIKIAALRFVTCRDASIDISKIGK